VPYSLNVIEKPGYLHFQVTGGNSLTQVRAHLAEIHATCVQRRISSILIEETIGTDTRGAGPCSYFCFGSLLAWLAASFQPPPR
jgi:hypothetical protein